VTLQLPEIITVDKDKCVGCHACIAACPVKYCNDGSTDIVSVNNNLCIGCGNCIKACSHEARLYIDDSARFFNDAGKIPMVAIVAPSIAANFPHDYLRFNGWLKHMGIDAIFDVSFGAELTVRSYLEHIKVNKPKMVISQPCPAIVTYIQIYQPELIPFLAPVDSPMLHTIKMVRTYYTDYSNHRTVVISPCIAKRREFAETGLGDYNVTYQSITNYFKEHACHLISYDEVDYDNPPAERAVLFSTPGGLLRTAQREVPDAAGFTRKIEGSPAIYHYLKKIPASCASGTNPLLVDCLNCELGCNGGTGTFSYDKSPDELETLIEQRNRAMKERYRKKGILGAARGKKELKKVINRYWKPGLYARSYRNLSALDTIKTPDDRELTKLYATLNKFTEKDMYNCGACGYGSCLGMATALYNGLNKPEHCLYNQYALLASHNKRVSDSVKELSAMVAVIAERSTHIAKNSSNVTLTAQQVSHSVNTVSLSVSDAQEVMGSITKAIDGLKETIQEIAVNSEKTHKITSNAVIDVRTIQSNVDQLGTASASISSVIDTIIEIAEQTKLLALNATIEAARAGDAGKGFAVVASEVKDLARQTNLATVDIKDKITNIVHSTEVTIGGIQHIGQVINDINQFVYSIAAAVEEQSTVAKDIAENVARNADSIDKIARNVASSATGTNEIADNITEVNSEIAEIAQSVDYLNKQTEVLDLMKIEHQ
jgi:Na+-translocating ferredoxin:NAD+ oxidoreductase RNF subunit RnfB